MRNKGAILTLTIALALVCLYQLSFTWKAESVKKQAKEFAGGDPVKEDVFLDSISNEVVYNILVSEFTFREVQEREINFGLDLKGGMNVILEISTVDVLRSLANNSQDTTFRRALVRAKELQRQTNRDYITLFGEAFEEIDPDASMAAIFTTQELRDKINYNTPNDEVLKVVREEAEGAIDNAFNIIATRIDQFGVVQPNIQRLETKDRILVDLPGVKDKNRVRKLLQGTANLEFWETFDNTEIIQSLYSADNILRSYIATQKELAKDSALVQAAPAPSAEQVAEGATQEIAEETTESPSSWNRSSPTPQQLILCHKTLQMHIPCSVSCRPCSILKLVSRSPELLSAGHILRTLSVSAAICELPRKNRFFPAKFVLCGEQPQLWMRTTKQQRFSICMQ